MKISVLTTSCNYEKYIKEAINSVLAQSYIDFEYIIFDDGSTDNSISIIKDFQKKDSRIKLFTHPDNKNEGLIKTIQEGIKQCSGDYIIFVESDDTITPNYIEEKIKVLEKYPSAAVIFNQINPVGDEKRVSACKKHLKKVSKIITSESFDYYELFGVNIIPTFSCVMLKKEVIKNIPFEFSVPKCFDWYLWNYIIQHYDIVFLDEILTNFRLHKTSFSCKKTKKSVYNALLELSEKKYKNEFIYKLFEKYKNYTRLEKLLRPICRVFDKFVYKRLYISKQVKVLIAK